MKPRVSTIASWSTGVVLAVTLCTSNAAVFHILDGKVCVQEGPCPNNLRIKGCYDEDNPRFSLNKGSLIAEGTTEISFQNRLGQVVSRQFMGCTGIRDLNATPEEPEKLTRVMSALVTGSKSTAQGVKRLKPGVVSLAGMPSGDILKPERQLVLDFTQVLPRHVERLQLIHLESSTSLVDVLRPDKPFAVSAKRLSHGAIYRWLVDAIDESSKVRYQNEFRVADRVDQDDVESEIRGIADTDAAGPMGRLMIRAAVYDDYGLVFDRDRLLGQITEMQKRKGR